MRWPREDWVDAVWASETLKPLQRLVAFSYARHAGDRTISWVSESQLQTDTGLSRDAARRARDGLVEAGWLVLESKARQQYAARYRLVIVERERQTTSSRTPQTTSSRTSDSPDVRETTPDVREPYPSAVRETTPDVREKAPRVVLQEPPPPLAGEPADELWMVVVGSLPDDLAQSLTRTRPLDDALLRLDADGWTPEALGTRTRSRGWVNAQAGAVVAWLSNLPAATPRPAPTQIRRRCPVYGHEHSPVTPAGVCSLCRAEQLEVSA